jgi:hypothetical protein
MKLQVKSGSWYDRTCQNRGEDIGDSFKSNKKGKYNDLHLKIYEKRPFNIHLKVKRPDIPLVEGKKEKKWGQFVSSMLWLNPRSDSNTLDNILGLFGK